MSEMDMGTSLSVGDVGIEWVRSAGWAFRLLCALPGSPGRSMCAANDGGGCKNVPSGWCGDGGSETGNGKLFEPEELVPDPTIWISELGAVVALQRDWDCGGGTRLTTLLEFPPTLLEFPPVLQCEYPLRPSELKERDEEE
jgi:hypothetical protein